jgi:hypothetical protein
VRADLDNLSATGKRAIDPAAPLAMRALAAKGVLPGATPAEILLVMTHFARGGDADLSRIARDAFRDLPAPILTGALSANLPSEAIEELVPNYGRDPDSVLKLLRMPRMSKDALCLLAQGATQQIAELIATNETLLLKYPEAIEKLYMNKATRMSTADRLLDLAVRNHIELNIPAFKQAAEAILGLIVAEPVLKGGADPDKVFEEIDRLAEQLSANLADTEDTHRLNDKGEEEVVEKMVPLYAQIANMSVTQKIRRATLGTSAERLLLVRDTNRLVATAAASSPMLNENDAARIATSRAVSEDVLRIIARNPEFTRSYQVKLNLVMNPRTPFTFSSRLLPLLRDNDLRLMTKSKNVPSAIQSAARNMMARKQR